MTTATATKEIFDFPVVQKNCLVDFNGNLMRTEKDCIIRTDTQEILGYVSAKEVVDVDTQGNPVTKEKNYYRLIEHKEVVTAAREVIASLNLTPKENTVLTNNGARMYHEFNFPTIGIEPQVGDYVSMKLTLRNSLDGTRKVGFDLGGLRKVCTNGLIAFRHEFIAMFKHTGAFNMDETRKNLSNAITIFETELLKDFKTMASIPVTPEVGTELITTMVKQKELPQVYGEAVAKVWSNPDNANLVVPEVDDNGTIKDQYITIMQDTSLDHARTLWSLYNAITLIITHYVISYERRLMMYDVLQKRMKAFMKQGA